MRMRPKKNRETRMERVKDLFEIKNGKTLYRGQEVVTVEYGPDTIKPLTEV